MAKRKKRVCLLINSLYNGGAEKVLAVHANALIKRGYEVDVVMLEKDHFYTLDSSIKVTALSNLLKEDNKLKKLIYLPFLFIKFVRFLKKSKHKKIFSYMEIPNLFAIFSKLFVKDLKTMISIHVNLSAYYTKGLYSMVSNFFIKRFYKYSNKIIVVSKEIKKTLIEDYGFKSNQVDVIYNPIDFKEINRMAKQDVLAKDKKLFSKSFVFTNVGRLTKQKGQNNLIQAFRHVVDAHKEAKLLIIGDGELQTELENLVKELKLEKNVFLLGKRKNVFSYLNKSDCFIFPSLWEGFSIVLLEAISTDLPIISADCKSGPRELLEKDLDLDTKIKYPYYAKEGILIKMYKDGDSQKKYAKLLSDMMIRFMEDKSLQKKYSKGSRRGKDFSIENIVKEIDAAISDLK